MDCRDAGAALVLLPLRSTILIQAPWLTRVAAFSKPLYASLVSLSQWIIRGWTEPVREMRRELGLDPGPRGLFAARHRPCAPGDVLADHRRAQPDWPANTRITGFAFYDRYEPMPPALSEFLAAGEPPIVFTLGSAAVFHPGEFYRASVEATRRIGRRAVLLVGPEPTDLPATDERTAVASYAPFSELFPRAAALVHQGGIGTTAQALRAGRPMAIVPHSHDQPDNAARATRLGVAKTIGRRDYSAATAADALRTLLDDPSYAARAARSRRGWPTRTAPAPPPTSSKECSCADARSRGSRNSPQPGV